MVTETSEIVSKALPHVLDGVNLTVFDPLVVLVSWVQPEGEPVRIHVTANFVVEFHLRHAIFTDVELAGFLCFLVNAGFAMDSLAGNRSSDGVGVFPDIWLLEELSCKPVASAGAAALVMPSSIEKFAWINMVPFMVARIKFLKLWHVLFQWKCR